MIVCCVVLSHSMNLGSCTVTQLRDDTTRAIHALFMALVWAVLIPVSIVTAKFQRHRVPKSGPRPWWLIRHQAYGYLALLLTAVAVIAVAYGKGTTGHFQTAHSWLGLCVLLATVALVWIGTTELSSGLQSCWWKLHKTLGYCAVIAATFAVFTGIKLYFPKSVSNGSSVVFITCAAAVFIAMLARTCRHSTSAGSGNITSVTPIAANKSRQRDGRPAVSYTQSRSDSGLSGSVRTVNSSCLIN